MSACKECGHDDELAAARREVRTCQLALDKGGEPHFWRRRLVNAAKRYEAAAAILRMQIAAMEKR